MQASGMMGAMPGGVPGGAMVAPQEMPTDDRESVHSGRSSTNNKDR